MIILILIISYEIIIGERTRPLLVTVVATTTLLTDFVTTGNRFAAKPLEPVNGVY
jgi:hypothetical protein